MNAKDILRMRALHAKLGSDNEAEANAARHKILEILKRHTTTWNDLSGFLESNTEPNVDPRDDKKPPKHPELKPRQQLGQEQRRALELIAETPRGCTEDTILVVHGFRSTVVVGLIRDGLATSKPELVDASGRMIKVVRVNITDAGRRALKGSAEPEWGRSGVEPRHRYSII